MALQLRASTMRLLSLWGWCQEKECRSRWCLRRRLDVYRFGRGYQAKGEVEVFALCGHKKAKICYGWSHPDGPDNTGERFVTVLEIPPVVSPKTAVKMAIYSDIKKGKL
ncbi:MAG: hypothetical protein ABSF51_11035 [Verrucomicrobiota bacterium]